MRKTSIRLIFAFALAATLTACGGGGGGGTPPGNSNWDSLTWDTDNWS